MNEFNREADYWPTEPEAIKRLEGQIEFGELAQLTPTSVSGAPRYLVTYLYEVQYERPAPLGDGCDGDQPINRYQPRFRILLPGF